MSDKCEICKKNAHKYKCPKCSVKTCSLDCCKKHKEETSCDGKRDKTAFVSKSDFNEQVLLNDYKFLEEQARIIDIHRRRSPEKRKFNKGNTYHKHKNHNHNGNRSKSHDHLNKKQKTDNAAESSSKNQ